MYLLCATWDSRVRYAPLYVRSFPLCTPRKLMDAQRILDRSYDQLETVPDRLRWCRHRLGLMQKEVADRAGISRSVYIQLETGACDVYPIPILDKLAALYNIPVADLLDDYNRFLYLGQARLIRAHRQSLGLGKKPYARYMGISPTSLRLWEAEKKRVTKTTWEKYFRGVIKD